MLSPPPAKPGRSQEGRRVKEMCIRDRAGPCVVTQVKTEENDGYKAVQVGFVDKREKLVNKPVKGHFDKAGDVYKRQERWWCPHTAIRLGIM